MIILLVVATAAILPGGKVLLLDKWQRSRLRRGKQWSESDRF